MDTQLITTTVSAITLVTEIFNVAKEFSTPYRKWKIRAKIKDELYEQEYRKFLKLPKTIYKYQIHQLFFQP